MKNGYYRKLKNPTGLAVVDLCDYYGKGLIITRVNVPEKHRGKGIGRELMREVCADADRTKTRLYLEVASYNEFSMTAEQLLDWYHRLGFLGTLSCVCQRRPAV